jgi:hypothetical protein
MSNTVAALIGIALLSASVISLAASRQSQDQTRVTFSGRGWTCSIDRDINPELVSVKLEVRE